jgi:hypothetical protein
VPTKPSIDEVLTIDPERWAVMIGKARIPF